VTLQAERCSSDMWLPVATVQEVRRIIEPLIKTFRGL
jgi:hypothetical protein